MLRRIQCLARKKTEGTRRLKKERTAGKKDATEKVDKEQGHPKVNDAFTVHAFKRGIW